MGETYHCERCGWNWRGKVAGKTPAMCPNCKSRVWQTPKEARRDVTYREAALEAAKQPVPEGQVRCQVCGYTWAPRIKHPVECARCHSRDWDKQQIAGI